MQPFEHVFNVPTKDFKDIKKKKLTVHPIIDGDKLIFTVTIPKYIYEKVLGTEQKYKTEYIQKSHLSPVLDKKIKFRNKLKNDVFLELINSFEEICRDAMQVQTIQDSKKDKVILVKFSCDSKKDIDDWNHAPKGIRLKSHFQFFVCYKRRYKEFVSGKMKNKYESLEQYEYGLFKRYFDKVENEFDVIKWTAKREAFFKHIEESFIELHKRMNDYFGEMTNKKVEQLISMQKEMKLLPEYSKPK